MKAQQVHAVHGARGAHSAHQEEPSVMTKWIRPLLTGTIAGLLCCFAALLLFSAIMAAQDIPQMAVTPMAVVAAAFGAFIGGLISARAAGSRGLLYGAACGAVMYLIVMIAGFAVLKDIRGIYALVKLAVMVGCAGIGGVIGVNMRKRR